MAHTSQSDLFALAASNLVALARRYDDLQGVLSGGDLAGWEQFGAAVAQTGHVSINMRTTGLLRFIDSGRHMNVYEVAAEVSSKTGRPVDEILQKHLGKYYEKRVSFDTHFVDGQLFRYGALNIGCAGATRYGEFCLVLNTTYVDQLAKLAYLKSDSLRDYMLPGPTVNEPAIREDLATHAHRHMLASIKYEQDLRGKSQTDWSEVLCNSDSYIEAIFVGDFEVTHLRLVRITLSDYQRFADLAIESVRENATRADRLVAADFARLLGLLGFTRIELETTDA
jgi:hypothetical protein